MPTARGLLGDGNLIGITLLVRRTCGRAVSDFNAAVGYSKAKQGANDITECERPNTYLPVPTFTYAITALDVDQLLRYFFTLT